MDGFTLVDGVVLAVVVISAVLAYARGLVRETLSIVGWIVAGIAAFAFAPAVGPLIREAPYVPAFLQSCEISVLAGFAAVFAVALIVVSIFTPLLSGAVQNSALGPVDQGLGFLFGVARGVLLVVIAFVVYDQVLGGETGRGGVTEVDDSRSRAIFAGVQQQLSDAVPADAPLWIAAQYETMTQNCN